ncbi:MAG: fibronectin type III domain-containing protein [Clostridiales bacterium]|nr:fibronectin type III domain-containing protein [Candidatus Crickella equi]
MKKTIVSIISLAMVLSMAPAGMVWATDDGSVMANKAEVSVNTEASALAESELSTIANNDGAENKLLIKNEINTVAQPLSSAGVVVDSAIKNGTISLNGTSGTAKPAGGYDLAAIKVGSGSNEQYVEYKGNVSSGYSFNLPSGASGTLTAYFYNLKKWDGAVDVSWYDPDKTEFDISTPAQLAGLAAIVNGAVDTNVTKEIMIKDNDGRSGKGGSYKHEYINCKAATADLLTPNQGGQVRDTVYRLPEVKHKKLAEDDVLNDFKYRTVRLTADMDMGDVNWTPIGGKYALNPTSKDGKKAHVVDTRFQGVFDGQGHTVTIKCDRIATKGFAYAMEIALIGYLGGGVDYKNGYPKDTYMDYAKEWVPTARNVVVKGSVRGMRMSAGVVGRTGETNYGVVVENCANYASVYSTDMRGCAGIVAAAWGKTIIRNCFNAGTIHSCYWEFGGICGSNGYEGSEGRNPAGASIYNCYNIGEVAIKDSGKFKYDGQEIGVDGQAFASYEVENCYYLSPSKTVKGKTGYNVGTSNVNRRAKVKEVSGVNLKSAEILDKLNRNGAVFMADSANVNKGYPVLFFQTSEYKSNPSKFGTASVSIDSTQHGKVTTTDKLSGLAFGSIVDLTATPDKGYKLSHYEFTVDGKTIEAKTGSFVTVCGKNVKVKGVFVENTGVKVAFPEKEDGEHYYITVTKTYDVNTGSKSKTTLHNGDTLVEGDIIKIVPHMKSGKNLHPDIKSLEYTGEFADPVYTENSLLSEDKLDKTYKVTGETTICEITFKPGTQGKRWTSVASTSWYKKSKKTFTITTAKQLAGLAKLVESGKSFKGKTIKLGADISLKNTKANSGDTFSSERNWTGIGTDRYPFEGTFDGQGHTVSNINRNFAFGYCEGDNAGLFGVTEGAVIKNVNVTCGSYVNDDNAKMECSFSNGANGGGIVGDATDTTIENCSADVVMNLAFNAGGIAGIAEGSTSIYNCTSTSVIDGDGSGVGGIVGTVKGSGIRIQKCRNDGKITSISNKVGGILGDGGSYTVAVSNCKNYGDITTEMRGSSYKYSVGGIIGFCEGNTTCSGCVNNGTVTANGTTCSVAGIAGNMSKGTIENCYNAGSIVSNTSNDAAEVAGIANLGSTKSYNVTVENCYNIGKMSKGAANKAHTFGGIVAGGSIDCNKIENSFCSTSSVAAVGGSAGIAGEVVADDMLKTYAATLGSAYLDDTDNANQGFPVLAWESVAEITKLSVAKSGKTAAKLTWKVSGPAKGYQVYRATSFNGKYKLVKTLSKKTFTNKSLKKGKTYFYKVRAYKNINGKKAYGAFSAVKSIKIKK